jgi:hypothetical protein
MSGVCSRTAKFLFATRPKMHLPLTSQAVELSAFTVRSHHRPSKRSREQGTLASAATAVVIGLVQRALQMAVTHSHTALTFGGKSMRFLEYNLYALSATSRTMTKRV